MEADTQKPTYIHDAFISYSRKDTEFAKRLEKTLESYKPPKELKVPQRNLDVFRDEEDFTGVEYQHSVAKHLKDSAKLIVLCSPNSRKSKYVNDEIRLFAEANGGDNIISILVSGIPNNEAKPGQEEEKAFPDALCEAMEMPLATSYLGFDLQNDKVNKGIFYGPWYTILANLYNISRSEIEQREKRRQARRRNFTIGIVSGVITILAVALVFALISRQEAVRQRKFAETQREEAVRQRNVAEERRKIAVSRQLAMQASNHLDDQLDLSLLLSIEAYRTANTLESQSSMLIGLGRNPHLIAFFHGLTNYVSSIALSPDGKILAAGGCRRTFQQGSFCEQGEIILWDVATRQPIGKPLIGHVKEVYSLAFSPDGRILASGSCGVGWKWCEQGEIILWDVTSQKPIGQSLEGHDSAVTSLAFSPDGRTLVSGKGLEKPTESSLIVWDVATRRPVGQFFIGYEGGILSIAFSPDGKTLVLGSGERGLNSVFGGSSLVLWDVATRRQMGKFLTGNKGGILSVAFSPDGKTLALGSCKELPEEELLQEYPTYCKQGEVLLWDFTTQRQVGQPLFGHEKGVDTVAFSPDGKTLVSVSSDSIIFWDVNSRQPSRRLILPPQTEYAPHSSRVGFDPDGQILTYSSRSKTIILLDITADSMSLGQPLTRHGTCCVAFSPDGKLLASSSEDEGIILWDVTSRKPISQPFTSHTGGMAFSPDGKILATGGCGKLKGRSCEKGEIRLWDVNSHKLIGQPLAGHTDTVVSLTFSPDGKTLASRSRWSDKQVILWDVAIREPIGQLSTRDNSSIFHLAFSPDSKMLAFGSGFVMASGSPIEGSVTLWDIVTQQPIGGFFTNDDFAVYSVAFSPDGKTLASGIGDESITLWDVATRQQIGQPLTGGGVEIDFSPDGKTLAGRRYDGSIILWDVATRQPIGKLLSGYKEEISRISSVVFTRDGKMLASSGDEGITLWNVSSESWVARACGIANRNLSYDEWRRYLGDDPYSKICPKLPIHPSFIERGRNLAVAGDIKGAVAIFRRAKELDPNLKLNPEAEAQQYATSRKGKELIVHGKALVEQGDKLRKQGKVEGAMAAYKEANMLFAKAQTFGPAPDVSSAGTRIWDEFCEFRGLWENTEEFENICIDESAEPRTWYTLCEFGSLWGNAADFIDACDQAVALNPENVDSHDYRGVARALTGNGNGAIEDFQVVIDRTYSDAERSQRQRWIDTLRAGKNPFTPEEIEKLRKE